MSVIGILEDSKEDCRDSKVFEAGTPEGFQQGIAWGALKGCHLQDLQRSQEGIAQGSPVTPRMDSFRSDFKKGFQETAHLAEKLSPLAEKYAEQHYGKDYADAIHASTQTTGQIANGLDYFQLQNRMRMEPECFHKAFINVRDNFWHGLDPNSFYGSLDPA